MLTADPTAPADSSPQLISNAGALCTAVATHGVFRRAQIGGFSPAAPLLPPHVIHAVASQIAPRNGNNTSTEPLTDIQTTARIRQWIRIESKVPQSRPRDR